MTLAATRDAPGKAASKKRKRVQAAKVLVKKGERLEARISVQQKELFKRAADLLGRSVTDFVVSSAQAAAVQAIREQAVIALGTRDQEVFARALTTPPEPAVRLRAAAARYKKKTR